MSDEIDFIENYIIELEKQLKNENEVDLINLFIEILGIYPEMGKDLMLSKNSVKNDCKILIGKLKLKNFEINKMNTNKKDNNIKNI